MKKKQSTTKKKATAASAKSNKSRTSVQATPKAAAKPGRKKGAGAGNPYVTPELYAFFRELREHNDREWFETHKPRFIEHVREPLRQLIRDFAPRLKALAPCYLADDRTNGGSLFRIYRDTRFGKDKTPYKTNAGVHFRHEAGKDAHAPGFYLHLDPDEVFIGVGCWRPETAMAKAIREAIVEDPAAWKKALAGKTFAESFALAGDSLSRPPRGFDKDHPLIEDLKRKDFIAVTQWTPNDTLAPDLLDRLEASCKAAAPFARFLTHAGGEEY